MTYLTKERNGAIFRTTDQLIPVFMLVADTQRSVSPDGKTTYNSFSFIRSFSEGKLKKYSWTGKYIYLSEGETQKFISANYARHITDTEFDEINKENKNA